MEIQQLFYKPVNRPINGVVKADQDDNQTVFQELDEYIVTNELDRHFRAFFESYNTPNSDPSISGKVGVWISGFFGSGKSHFLKILSYLLENREAADLEGDPKKALEFFDEHKIHDALLRADISRAVSNPTDVILFNIDSKANTSDGGNAIINVFLRVFNEHQGYSGDHPHLAHMERHLEEKGAYDTFKSEFEKASGHRWNEERDGYQFYQDDVEKAIGVALDLSPEAAHKWFEESEEKFSVSVENFCHWVKEYLDQQSPDHRMIFLVDEVGQFIGSDTKLMLTLQTITENLGTVCKGRAWVVVTSQADMDAVLGELSASKANDFSKIAGRFKTRLSLSSSNTDEVIQKRLLKKTEEAKQVLTELFEKKGDILKNQITFDRSGPALKNYDGPESFVDNYPFAPYHFQLVQKVFEEIRKVGATGAHLAFGERSMLDAFQMAARAIGEYPLGALVPFNAFYESVEGFLDPAVKRTIDQAKENPIFDDFDVKMLRTLFMIRYVDLIKGTLNNLVTLFIDEIDADKLALRKQIDDSLARLEKESLITRSGDEFLFLTNEERDIARKIKATDIASTEENKELSNLVYKDLLRDKNKLRYNINKVDYGIGRYLDGHSLDGRLEMDLAVEVITPLDTDYQQYTDAACLGKSGEGNGRVLIKLPDHHEFFIELRTWLKTNKYIRLSSDRSQPDLERILADRGRENQTRKSRLRQTVEELLLQGEIFCLGQKLNLTSSSVVSLYDEACEYLLENTYSKLGYLKVLQDDPYRELNAVLLADDIGQQGLALDGAEGNPLAVKEVEQYIGLRASGDRVLVADVVEKFSKRPYGWPDGEILLVLGRLAASARILLQRGGGTLALEDAFEPLRNTRSRREVSIIKKRQTEEGVLQQARQLSQQLFTSLGPAAEKELFEFYVSRFNKWLDDLKSYKSKTEVGHFPGKEVIERSILALERVLANRDSYDFFEHVVNKKSDYLDLEEDYRDVHEFFTSQIGTWQKLQQALKNFEPNRSALEKDSKIAAALQALKDINAAEHPYSQLNQVEGHITAITAANDQLLSDKRAHGVLRVEQKIEQLKGEIDASALHNPELSNQLLRPLQLIKDEISKQTSVAQIYLKQTQDAQDVFDESLAELQAAVESAIAKPPEPASCQTDQQTAPVSKPTPVMPKPVESVAPAILANQTSGRVYLETLEDADEFITELSSAITKAIESGKRVRIE